MDCSSNCITSILHKLKQLIKAESDGYIYTDEEVFQRWNESFSNVTSTLENYRQLKEIEFYHKSE